MTDEMTAFSILEQEDDRAWPNDRDPLAEAIELFEVKQPEPLCRLLNSASPLVVKRGLFLFGELGSRAEGALDDALLSARHDDAMARSSLMNGVLCFVSKLDATQVSQILHLVEDENELVRSKMITLLGALRLETLRQAIEATADSAVRLRHAIALENLLEINEPVLDIIRDAGRCEVLDAAYLLASIERSARSGRIESVPLSDGQSYLVTSVLENARRLLRQKMRRNPGPVSDN